jgi:hypothetical protein
MRWTEIAGPTIMEGDAFQVPAKIYHVSETSKEDHILSRGLHRRDKDAFHVETSYKQRIYFFAKYSPEHIMDYIGEVFSERYGKSISRDRPFLLVPYTIFEVDTSMLEGFEFYQDPVSFTYATAIYTESGDIPPEAIRVKSREKADHRKEVGLVS